MRPEPELDLVVARRAAVADGVITLDLRDSSGAALPAWAPGAHIDLILGPGLIRQFSLCGAPADPGGWRIAVLREPAAGAVRRTFTTRSGPGLASGSAGHATASRYSPRTATCSSRAASASPRSCPCWPRRTPPAARGR